MAAIPSRAIMIVFTRITLAELNGDTEQIEKLVRENGDRRMVQCTMKCEFCLYSLFNEHAASAYPFTVESEERTAINHEPSAILLV